jgi:hypothetical protein
MSITKGIIIGMGVMLGFGSAVMGYQLITEPGEMGQRITSAMLGIGVAGGIFWGLYRAWEKAQ